MNETRLYLASQGYLDSIDGTQRGWALVAVFFIIASLLAGYLLLKRSQRIKSERHRLRREKQKRSTVKKI